MPHDDRSPRLVNLVHTIAVLECRLVGQLPMEKSYNAQQSTQFCLNRAYVKLTGYVMATFDRRQSESEAGQ